MRSASRQKLRERLNSLQIPTIKEEDREECYEEREEL